MKIKLYLTGIFLLMYSINTYSQNGLSLGLGGYTAVARGVEAVYWNPAHLGIKEKDAPRLEILLFSLNAGAGNNAFNLKTITKYMKEDEAVLIDDDDKREILDAIDDDGLKFDAALNAAVFSFRYKNFGIGVENHSYGFVTMPKDVYENVLYRFGPAYYDYSVDGEGFAVSKIKFSYGRTLLRDQAISLPMEREMRFTYISMGISASYLFGMGYGKVEKGSGVADISENGILPRVDFLAKYAQFGNGLGADIGFSAYTSDNWSIGMMFENVLGSINWNSGQEQAVANVDFGKEPLFIFGDGQLEDLDMDSVSTDTTYEIGDFSSRLPLNFRMGVAKDFNHFLVNCEWSNFNKTNGLSLGGYVKLGILKIALSWKRMDAENMWGTGFALDSKHFYFDLGVSGRSGFSLMGAKGVFYGTSMRFGI